MFNNLEHGLFNLLGIGRGPAQPTQQPLPKAAPVNGFQPMPGHYQQAKQYAANPDSFVGSGIDPKLFGYPADQTSMVMPRGGIQQSSGPDGVYPQLQGSWPNLQSGFDGTGQGYTQDDLSNGIQGGVVNQGAIPLQGTYGIQQILNRR